MTKLKAVIPVAGLGMRMLPATKAIPKEMLPIVDTIHCQRMRRGRDQRDHLGDAFFQECHRKPFRYLIRAGGDAGGSCEAAAVG